MRYIIGIDLGTTNCAMAYIDTSLPNLTIKQFSIPQLAHAGKIESLFFLPSFCYLSAEGEWPVSALQLPWKKAPQNFVGHFAKIQGAKTPTRLVHSAKSWLCNAAAHRCDKILPIECVDFLRRLSPVEASANYLIHLKEAWNANLAKGDPELELEEQEIYLTVPASFDEVARSLTIEAAKDAGLQHVNLLEEPVAAFYSWISHHEKNWELKYKENETVLVCDTGGGTTDFSLIEIVKTDGKLEFQRVAVGDHLLLGGDNIDIALAHFIERRLKENGSGELGSHQWLQLQAEARHAKEVLLESGVPDDQSYTIFLQGTGSSVLKGSLSAHVNRKEIEDFILNGFFGFYSLDEALKKHPKKGLRSMGLPYEEEPSITKQLAHFLQQSGYVAQKKGIDFVLFNGGTFKPDVFKCAIEKALWAWFPGIALQRLESASLDLAVSKGAAYYGKARRGLGISVGGGLPRNYYIKLEVKDEKGSIIEKALTVLPKGTKEGYVFNPMMTFNLRPNVPVSFHLLTSHVRLHDKEGDMIDIDPLEMQTLPPIQTILRFGQKALAQKEITLPVKLGACLTPIGTIDLWLESQTTNHKWKLEFQLKSASGQDFIPSNKENFFSGEVFDKKDLEPAKAFIENLFTRESLSILPQAMEKLESLIGAPRNEWGIHLLRELCESLFKIAPHRKITAKHEERWWNLAGYFLRPGFGFALDDFRMKEFWKILLGDLKTPKSADLLLQMWICVRRLSGGFNKGQQVQILSELIGPLIDKRNNKLAIGKKESPYHFSEKMRSAASLELLDIPFKIKLGNALMERLLQNPAEFSTYWALGRVGARHLLYGTAGHVVPPENCVNWIEKLLNRPCGIANNDSVIFLLKQLGCKTDKREINLPENTVQQILKTIPSEDLAVVLLQEKRMTAKEQSKAFGDDLPPGLMLDLSGEIK